MSLQARLRFSSPFFLALALAFSSSLVASDAVAQVLDRCTSPDDGCGYISLFGTTFVAVYDPMSKTVVNGVDLLSGKPNGLAVTPNGKFVYVANTNGSVSVIRTSDNMVDHTIGVGTSPEDVAITSDGAFVYVTNNGSASLSIIDTSTKSVTTVTVGSGPFGVAAVDIGGKRLAYVANSNDDTVSVVEVLVGATITASELTTIPVGVGTTPRDVVASPNGDKVYVANEVSGTITTILTATNMPTPSAVIGAGPFGLAINRKGDRLYATLNGANEVVQLDTDPPPRRRPRGARARSHGRPSGRSRYHNRRK